MGSEFQSFVKIEISGFLVQNTMEHLKVVLKSLLRTEQHASMKLLQLEKEFKSQEGVELKNEAHKFGFDSVVSMLRTFKELEVHGEDLGVLVQCIDSGLSYHISKLNRSKKFDLLWIV